MISTRKVLSYIVLLFVLMVLAECSVNNGGQMKKIQSRETNVFNFLRLLIMRLVYGVATAMGFSDGISEFMGGAFVPPGVDDDYGDYADYDF